MNTSSPRFGCPECNSERVIQWNLVMVPYYVTEWDEKGSPVDFDSDDVVWDSSTPADPPYSCRDCDHEFSIPKPLNDDVIS